MGRAHLLPGEVTLAVVKVARQLELLARDAVGAVIGTLVDLAAVLEAGQEPLNTHSVTRFGRTDEVVVASVDRLEHWKPGVGDEAVCPVLWRDAISLGGAHDLLPVLVDAREEPDALAALPVPPGQDVAGRRGVGVPDVRGIVDVVDRRREVEGLGI